jgi:hypothetical protein
MTCLAANASSPWSPSPPFRGEREGPGRGSDWEGEVGNAVPWI